ncbi:MAG: hypothetical protein ACTHOE_11430 [Conexibacter sp.]
MCHKIKALGTVVGAIAILAMAVGVASGRNFSLSNQTFRATFAEFRVVGVEISVTCRVTLEGSFHSRTIAKVREALIGAITAATAAHPCAGGEAFFFNGVEREPNTLPWHLQYDSFEGTLPSAISGVTLVLSRFRYLIQNFICAGAYGSETDRVFMRFHLVSGVLQEAMPISGRNSVTRVITLSGICPATTTLSGGGAYTALNSATRVTVTLI